MHEEMRLELISRWIDGDLGSEDEKRLLEDIGEQERYRSLIEEMVDLRQAVRKITLADRPPEMMDLLVEGFRERKATRQRISLMLPFLAAAALLAVGILLVREVGRQPIRPHTGKKQVFALKNLPAASEDAPLGPLAELLAEDLPEPEFGVPHILLAQGPLPEPPPTGRQSLDLRIGTEIVSVTGLQGSVGDVMQLEFGHGVVLSCESRENPEAGQALCRGLLGREFPEIPPGIFTVEVVSSTIPDPPGEDQTQRNPD